MIFSRKTIGIIIIFIVFGSCRKFEFNNPVDSALTMKPPANVHVIAVTESSVQISWTDVNSYAAGQKKTVSIDFEQCTDSTAYKLVLTTGIDSTVAFIPGSFRVSEKYRFRARLVAGKNISGYSAPVVSELVFTPPESLRVQIHADTSVTLQWINFNPFITQFEIEEQIDNTPFTLRQTVSKETMFVNIAVALMDHHQHSYRIRGRSKTNVSSHTSAVSTELILNAPDNVLLQRYADTALVLQWKNPHSFISQFEIEQSVNSGPFVLQKTVAHDSLIVLLSNVFTNNVLYSYRIRGRSKTNVTPYSASVSTELILNAPDNIQIQRFADSALVLQWKNPHPFISQFEIEQSMNGSPFALLKVVAHDSLIALISNVFTDNIPYVYRIRGRSSHNVTPYSSTIAHSTSIPAPSELAAAHLSPNAIELRWKDNSSYEKEFIIERKDNTNIFIQIGTTAPNMTVFTDNSLSATHRYEYRIRSHSSYNSSEPSQSIALSYSMKNVGLSKIFAGHTSAVYVVAINPASSIIASGSGDKTIKLWNTDGTLIRTITGHTGQVYDIVFSPDGLWLISGSLDKTIKIWRVSDGTLLSTLSGHTSAVNAISISPDGKTIASASFDKTVCLWRSSDGALLRTLSGHIQGVYAVAFSNDGSLIASGGTDQIIKVWKSSDGSLVWNLSGHTNNITDLVFTPDGATLLSGSYDNSIKQWRLSNGLLTRSVQSDSNSVSSLALSADGHTLMSGNIQEHFKIWNTDSYTLIQSTYAHADAVNTVAVNSTLQWFVTGGGDALVKLWLVNNEWVKE